VRALADAAPIEADSRDLSTIWSSVKRATSYASAGAAVIVLAIAGSNLGSPDPSETEHTASASTIETRTAVVAPAPSATSHPNAATSEPASRESAAATTPPTRSTETAAATPSAPTAPSLRRLVVPRVAVPSVDSLMRTVTRVTREADWEPNAVGGLLASTRDDDARVTPPVLIGSAPNPRFPEELRARGLESEVVVKFRVDEKGRVDTKSMQVLQSGHELFTTAVRNVLPRLRFEPARSAAPESKPQAAWVQFRAEFSARN
jgi:TonB family protein